METMNSDALLIEIEAAIRGNLHDFDRMFAAVNTLLHTQLDGHDAQKQTNYIHALMMHFASNKYWIFSFPSTRRVQLMAAVTIGRKYKDRSQSLAKLVAAGEAVLNMNIHSFKDCFDLYKTT